MNDGREHAVKEKLNCSKTERTHQNDRRHSIPCHSKMNQLKPTRRGLVIQVGTTNTKVWEHQKWCCKDGKDRKYGMEYPVST